MMIAGFSDNVGRRPAYIICFTIYSAANLGLALQNSYAALMVLRCLQSGGSSSTVALANGLVGDVITPAERGAYIAYASLGSILGPSLSPILGGLITQYLDFHWLFWFLLIFGVVFFVLLLLFLPETCRKVVGDGSIPPRLVSWSVTDWIRHRNRRRRGCKEGEKIVRNDKKLQIPNPLPTLKVAFDKETGIILSATGFLYAGLYTVLTGSTSLFEEVHGFNNIEIALMYLPFGVGGIASALTSGKLVDWNYRRHARKTGLPVIKNVRQDLRNFQIEHARLEVGIPFFYLAVAFIIGYGWVMGTRVSLAGPIILLFFMGYVLNGASQVLNALMVDLWPGRSAAATAANNLIRCELGAAASAAIRPMTEAMGAGLAYTTVGLIAVVASSTLWLAMRYGMGWRRERIEREEGNTNP